MKKALLIGLLASISTAQAGTLTAKPAGGAFSKPSSAPTIGKNVSPPVQNRSATPASTPAQNTPATAPAAPAAAAPAPASSGMGGMIGGMAAGALVGAGAAMLLSDSSSAAPSGTVADASIMPYSGNVEQDFMSGMLLWQNKNYAELINITNPYVSCTTCGDKEKFMIELNRLGKLNVGK